MLQRPSISSLSVEVRSLRDHSTLKLLELTNFPHTQHQCLISLSLKWVLEIGHSIVFSWAEVRAKISGWVVKSLTECPREFLHSKRTPSCRNFLKISGKLPEADNITLLLPQLSMSSQWRPALISNCMMSRWPLKEAQCKGLGFNYLVIPITTVLFSGFTSRYCWAAPFAIKSLTIFVNPRQQAHIKAVHFFLLFSS